MASWTLDLETREATLSDGEASLAAAEDTGRTLALFRCTQAILWPR